MFLLLCPRCGAHKVVSELSDPDAALQCGCCTLDHHHGQAANACSGAGSSAGHPGQACHRENGGADCTRLTPAGQSCPGGHCGPGVNGCTVCRPIIIEPLAGSVTVSGVGNA